MNSEKEIVRQLCEEVKRGSEKNRAILDAQPMLTEEAASNVRPASSLLAALHDAQGLLDDATPAPDDDELDQSESETTPPTEADELLAETLFQQAGKMLRQVSGQEARALGLLRKCTKDIYEVGKVLLEAQQLLKTNARWVSSLVKHQIPRSTAWEAIELYRRTGSDTERIFALTPTEAKTALGIYKERTSPNGKSSLKLSARKPSHHNRRESTPETAPTTSIDGEEPQLDELQPDEPLPEVTPATHLPDNFVLTEADHDAVTAFVEATGGWNRASQVFVQAWKLSQEREDSHAA